MVWRVKPLISIWIVNGIWSVDCTPLIKFDDYQLPSIQETYIIKSQQLFVYQIGTLNSLLSFNSPMVEPCEVFHRFSRSSNSYLMMTMMTNDGDNDDYLGDVDVHDDVYCSWCTWWCKPKTKNNKTNQTSIFWFSIYFYFEQSKCIGERWWTNWWSTKCLIFYQTILVQRKLIKGWNNASNFAMERNQSEYGRENKCLKEVAIKIIYRFIRNQSLVLLGF